jgi:predicted metal-dependent HD superfamily phosphohydrolase
MQNDKLARWCGLWTRLGARSEARPVFDELVRAYAAPGRAYHTLEHVRDCLARFDEDHSTAEHPDEVEMALWGHDVVYDPHASDNEEQSARWMSRALLAAHVSPPVVLRISECVLATRHEAPPSHSDAALVVDIDLSIFGRPEAEFDAYEEKIGKEYAWVPEAEYRAARIVVLESFLRRPVIFHTPALQRRCETQARVNLQRSIRRLR